MLNHWSSFMAEEVTWPLLQGAVQTHQHKRKKQNLLKVFNSLTSKARREQRLCTKEALFHFNIKSQITFATQINDLIYWGEMTSTLKGNLSFHEPAFVQNKKINYTILRSVTYIMTSTTLRLENREI